MKSGENVDINLKPVGHCSLNGNGVLSMWVNWKAKSDDEKFEDKFNRANLVDNHMVQINLMFLVVETFENVALENTVCRSYVGFAFIYT